MVSYFVPRGRLLMKASNLKHVMQQHKHGQQSPRWPMLRHFRQTSVNSKTTKPIKDIATTITTNTKDVNSNILDSTATLSKQFNKLHTKKTNEQEQKERSMFWRWTGFLLRWAPVGFCVFGAIQWQLHKKRCQREQKPYIASEFQKQIYRSLPLRIMSRCWGWLAACYIPEPLRPLIYGWYSNRYNVNLDEALYQDYNHYNSLSDFFTRPLKDGIRSIDETSPLISPADGKILHFGSATNSLIEQVKGVNYNIEDFLGSVPMQTNKDDAAYAESLKCNCIEDTTLYQCVIYLAPGDYHRFHSPTTWTAFLRRHFSGELLSVNPKVANWLPGLFCLNERVLYIGYWKYGFFSYTAVGATNVGSVKIYKDEELKTNRWTGFNVGAHKETHKYDELYLKDEMEFEKGDLVGQFNMGSTIVLLFEAPKNFQFDVVPGQKIRVGESLGHCSN